MQTLEIPRIGWSSFFDKFSKEHEGWMVTLEVLGSNIGAQEGDDGMIPRAVATLILPVSERDHLQGPPTAPVTLVEDGDYECPYCSQAHVVVQALKLGLGNLLRLVFRNFPLTTVHPHAEHAAEAAEAAGVQGKFWEMHDCLFTHQQALDEAHLLAYAAQLGLDVPRFGREMAHHRYAVRVREDFMSGVRSGVNGTPTFFINGMRYNGSLDLDALLATIEDAADSPGLLMVGRHCSG